MNIFITGVSRGIGKELVHLFCSNASHQVYGVARNKEALKALEKQHNNFKGFAFDLANNDWSELEAYFSSITQLDILINNAGLLVNKPFEDITVSDWNAVYAVNVFAPARLTQYFTPALLKSNIAHIVNVSSMGGYQGASKFPGLSAYSSSKAAIASLTECLAEEFQGRIKVNALCLGAAQTEMLAEAFPDYKAPVSAVEMASYIYYFAKHQYKFFNGKILPVSSTTP